jgi:phospholipase C
VRRRDGLELTIANVGAAGAGFSIYPADVEAGGPWFYAVEAGKTLQDRLPASSAGYDFALHGPNGFLRRFRGGRAAGVDVSHRYDGVGETLRVVLRNSGAGPVTVSTANAYAAGERRTRALAPGAEMVERWPIARDGHWYDISVTVAEDAQFLRRLAGHIETGRHSRSDPALDWPRA